MKNDPAMMFAYKYANEFKKITRGCSCAEIPLFQAMQKSLLAAGSSLNVKEYHGGSHQVAFCGNGSYARSKAKCELSDLMIVVYSPDTKNIRLTFLQAKSERGHVRLPCVYNFSANLEQWFLLSTRPRISGVAGFNPPPDLLSGALLPSVGSFGFFYKDQSGEFQIYYASADYLQLAGSYRQKNGRVCARGGCIVVKHASGCQECLSAHGAVMFAKNLYDLKIGTPVVGTTAHWLSKVLKFLIRETKAADQSSSLSKELLQMLPAGDTDHDESMLSNGFGAKSLVIMRSSKDFTA